MNPTTTIGAGCLLIENGQVLLVKPNYGKAKDRWILPGGFIDAGEMLDHGALRELKEETGQIGESASPFCVRYRLDPSDIYWVFRVQRSSPTPIVVQPSELLDARFMPIDFALHSEEVRPMTRYFVACAFSAAPEQITLPDEYSKNNFVYFFG